MRQIATDGYITTRVERTLLIATNGYIPFGGPDPFGTDVTLEAIRTASVTLDAARTASVTLEMI